MDREKKGGWMRKGKEREPGTSPTKKQRGNEIAEDSTACLYVLIDS